MGVVLVTGGSGFIGSHCILQLLAAGHEVRTTVRHLTREADVRAMLKEGGTDAGGRLGFVAADLSHDEGWAQAVKGCEYVLHVASPFPPAAPQHEDELIVPARDGALRVLRASRDHGVRRVVLTSSFAAIGYGHAPRPAPLTESDWTNPALPGLSAYVKSKTIAERAAWDFIEKEGGGLELSVINPTGVMGPVLGPDFSTSIALVKRMLDGAMPGAPKLYFGIIDVRDVASQHLLAMTTPAARGERFISVSGNFIRIFEIAEILRRRLGDAARKVPKRELPNWVVRLAALRDSGVRQFTGELGKKRDATSEKSQRLLGWSPRSAEDAIVATAESLLRLGLIKN
jgi:nucleoside-diphosphate-sugar epimerase